jgi:hypothetical protein
LRGDFLHGHQLINIGMHIPSSGLQADQRSLPFHRASNAWMRTFQAGPLGFTIATAPTMIDRPSNSAKVAHGPPVLAITLVFPVLEGRGSVKGRTITKYLPSRDTWKPDPFFNVIDGSLTFSVPLSLPFLCFIYPPFAFSNACTSCRNTPMSSIQISPLLSSRSANLVPCMFHLSPAIWALALPPGEQVFSPLLPAFLVATGRF